MIIRFSRPRESLYGAQFTNPSTIRRKTDYRSPTPALDDPSCEERAALQ
jgi:hypothetical protein